MEDIEEGYMMRGRAIEGAVHILRSCLRTMKAGIASYFVLYLANTIGLAYPFIVFAIASLMYGSYVGQLPQNAGRVGLVDLQDQRIEGGLLDEIVDSASGIDKLSFMQRVSMVLSTETGFRISEVILVDDGYPDFYRLRLIEGRYFSDRQVAEGLRVCVIGSRLRDRLFADTDPIGQSISIGEAQYEVVGLCANTSVANSTIIPAASMSESVVAANGLTFLQGGRIRCSLMLMLDDAAEPEVVRDAILRILAGRSVRAKWSMARDALGGGTEEARNAVITVSVIGILLTAFVFSNLGSIVRVIFETEKRSTAIKYALGVPRSALMMEKTVATALTCFLALVTFLIAVILGVGSVPLSRKIDWLDMELLRAGWPLLLFPSVLVTFAAALGETRLLMQGIFREDIASVLKER